MELHASQWSLCVWVFFVIFQSHRSLGCVDEERTALLEIKASLRYPDDYFSTWVENKTSDCCAWKHISCSDTTGFVSQLSLDRLFGGAPLLNASLFLPFKNLQHLDISWFFHQGWQTNQVAGIEKLSKLKKLEVLNLEGNKFNSNVLAPLSKLTSLKTLYLYANQIGMGSSTEIFQGFMKISKLKRLEFLDLSFNNLKGDVLASLSELMSLHTLKLARNQLGSSVEISQGIEKLAKLKKLEVLDLSTNDFNSNVLEPLSELTSLKTLYLDDNEIGNGSSSDISQGFVKISKLKRLESLHLTSNSLNGDVLASMSDLTSLRTLDLSYNQLGIGSSVEISQGFCKLKKLYGIDLSGNDLKGNIPPCLKNLTTLRVLDLSFNQFYGNIPQSLTSNMTSLKTLDLSNNQLTGSIPPSLLLNLTSLTVLDLSRNELSGNIPQGLISSITPLRVLDFSENQLTGSIPPFLSFNMTSLHLLSLNNNHFEGTTFMTSLIHQKSQLIVLGLANCNLNISTPIILKFLQAQRHLKWIDLSHNGIHGKFPSSLFVKNTMLKALLLRNNSISGRIQFPVPSPHFTCIDISDNHLEGGLQKNVGDLLHGVQVLNFSSNRLEGKLPTSLGSMVQLFVLDLSKNNFTGEMPESLALLTELYYLTLSDNRLRGLISPFFSRVSTLLLSNNQFTGFVQIPNNIIDYWWLDTLDVSQNNISGRMPTWIANFTHLRSLVLRDNSFGGPIPSGLCNLPDLLFLDLSGNEFSGSIPTCLNLTSLTYMHLQENKLSGPIPTALFRSSKLVTLDLNNNNFSGGIPRWLGSLLNLRLLLLKGNRLDGFLPSELCRLNKIGILDLSLNGFSGSIPSCFSNITFGMIEGLELDISYPIGAMDMPFDEGVSTSYNDTDLIDTHDRIAYNITAFVSNQEVDFVTKSLSSSYKGYVLEHMAGMDLSCNSFTGEIPREFGSLTGIRALNLSYNQFTGPIPSTLSKLKQLESMDLSHNRLSGEIPSELIAINTLAIFSVSYNNLSGRLPDMKAQFGTFSETSYEGNPYLCGPPLLKQCDTAAPTGSETVTAAGLSEKFGVDLISFLGSSVAAYMMSLLALVIVLYINPYWRRLWFDSVDACLSFVFPFWSEAIYRVSNPFT